MSTEAMSTIETTHDAVERAKLLRSALCAAASDAEELRATLLAERARHAEEVARLEAARLSDLETIEAWKLASGLECGGDPDGVTPAGMLRYWEGVEADRDFLRSLLPDVRACAEWMRDELIEGHELQALGCRILAALDSHECPECQARRKGTK